MALLIVADWRIGTDEAPLVDPGLHVHTRATCGSEHEHEVEHPESGRSGVAHPRFAAAGEGVCFTDSVGYARRFREAVLEFLQEWERALDPCEEACRCCAGRILALAIVVVGEELDILAFVDGKSCDPVGRARHIRPGEGNVRNGLAERVSIGVILTKVLVIAIARVAKTFVARKQVGLVTDFKGKSRFPFDAAVTAFASATAFSSVPLPRLSPQMSFHPVASRKEPRSRSTASLTTDPAFPSGEESGCPVAE